MERIDRLEQESVDSRVRMVGKKGVNYFRFLRREMAERIEGLGEIPRFDEVEPIANGLMARYIAGEIDAVDVAYTKFVSTSRQIQVIERCFVSRRLSHSKPMTCEIS